MAYGRNMDENGKKMEKAGTEKPTVLVKNRKKGIIFILCAVLVGVLALRFGSLPSYKANFIDELLHKVGLEESVYAVIIDAGSTGSRLLVPFFYRSILTGNVKLKEDLFIQTKPGLSNFADNPEEAGRRIQLLLDEAKKFIPESKWPETPVALRATAGLRLLKAHKADYILAEVSKVIGNSPFNSTEDSVGIMDGKDEGLFSWFTVNFLLDRLEGDMSRTVVTVDLGGGSMQITFAAQNETKDITKKQFIHPVFVLDKKIDMYSHSYLGLGLKTAREAVLLAESAGKKTKISSSCFHPSVQSKIWNYDGKIFEIRGAKNSNNEVDFKKCWNIIKEFVKKQTVDKPDSIGRYETVAFSYFFDRATEAGLVGAEGGTVTIEDFVTAAKKTCKGVEEEKEFYCLDLIFIATVLEEGFGLKSDHPVILLDTVDGHEISWALGAAYHIIETGL